MQRDEVRVIGWAGVSDSVGGGIVLPTGMVAFLLTDVEGSTKAWSTEPDAMARAMERHNAILDAAVSAHGGVAPPAQGEGDSIVGAFPRASDAVLAALDAQRALVAEAWPTASPLRVRMAVHAGEARTGPEWNPVRPSPGCSTPSSAPYAAASNRVHTTRSHRLGDRGDVRGVSGGRRRARPL